MRELVLILPTPSAADRAALAVPLGRARAAAVERGDWRGWLARRLGCGRLASRPPAEVAALAAPDMPDAAVAAPGGGMWFATPVALLAALDHVRMLPDGWVTLRKDEAAQLAADFAATLGGTSLSLAAAGAEGFLLSGLEVQALTHDPARVLGADVAPWLPAGEGAGQLRRLATEIEMWLHEHPLQRALRRRGSPPATTLWLWGGGAAAGDAGGPTPAGTLMPTATRDRAARAAAWPRGYGRDSWLAGLWQAAGERLTGDADAFAAIEPAQDRDTIVVVRAAAGEAEARWLAPALAQLAARRCAGVQCVIGDRAFRFSRFDLVKPWRRSVRWAAPA